MMPRWWALSWPPSNYDEREDVCSNDLVDGGDGRVTFNYLQQNVPEVEPADCTPDRIDTDPWGISG